MKEAQSEDILNFLKTLRPLLEQGLKILDIHLEQNSQDNQDLVSTRYINWDHEAIEVLKEMKRDLTKKDFTDKLIEKFSAIKLDKRKIKNEVMNSLKYIPRIHKKKTNGKYFYELASQEQAYL